MSKLKRTFNDVWHFVISFIKQVCLRAIKALQVLNSNANYSWPFHSVPGVSVLNWINTPVSLQSGVNKHFQLPCFSIVELKVRLFKTLGTYLKCEYFFLVLKSISTRFQHIAVNISFIFLNKIKRAYKNFSFQ